MASQERLRFESLLPQEGESPKQAEARRLTSVNAELEAIGFPPFKSLGNHRKGEVEIVTVLSHIKNEYVGAVLFGVIKPGRIFDTYFMYYNMKQVAFKHVFISGAICPVVVTDENNHRWMVFTRQYRPAVKGWTSSWPLDVPRGFCRDFGASIGEALLKRDQVPMVLETQGVPVSELPIGIVGRKLSPLILSGAVSLEEMSYLGLTTENNSIGRNLTMIVYVGFRTKDISRVLNVEGNDEVKIQFVRLDEVRRDSYKLGIDGEQSETALYRYFNMVDRR